MTKALIIDAFFNVKPASDMTEITNKNSIGAIQSPSAHEMLELPVAAHVIDKTIDKTESKTHTSAQIISPIGNLLNSFFIFFSFESYFPSSLVLS